MTSVITAMRKQKHLLVSYDFTLLLEAGAAPFLVQKMGMDGASILFTASMLMIMMKAMTKKGFLKRHVLAVKVGSYLLRKSPPFLQHELNMKNMEC